MDSENPASLNPPPPAAPFRLEISLLVALGLILIALLAHCAYLQLGPVGLRCRQQALRQHSKVVHLPARRGSILDRLGRELAIDVRGTGVFADPSILADPSVAAKKLSGILATPAPELLALITKARGRSFVWLKRDLSPITARQIQDLGIRGVALQSYQLRTYPQGSTAGHLIGFAGRDGAGLDGLELKFDRELTGTAGFQNATADPRRRTLFTSAQDQQAVRHGANVVLTIDSVIQQIAEAQLDQACTKFQAKWGLVLVMDPNNGQILAMANWPAFSPTEFRTSRPDQRRNRCLTDVYEPGSTFKPFVAAKALELGLFSIDDEIFCHNGVYRTGRRTLHDHGSGYGDLTFEDVVVHSSNIGMAIVGQRMNNKRLYRAVRDFGFGKATGIDLAGESPGLLASLAEWTSYSTTSIPMGQEIGVTGLQLLQAFCAIANDGLLYRPTLVSRVESPDGHVFWRQVPDKNPQQILEPLVAQLMRRRVLANVVQHGTGKAAKLSAWGVFGKTGTSQVPDPGGYVPDAFVGSFLGGAPVQNPRLCVLVSVGQPDRSIGYYGGTVAAPAVGSILAQSLAYLGVAPEPGPPTPQMVDSSCFD